MHGGLGRYTYNLKKNLQNKGLRLLVVCDKEGEGEFREISKHNSDNSRVLLEIVERVKPDIVHVQYEPGLYGLRLDPLNPAKTCTNIDFFYESCRSPIVTTFHSCYPFKQWMSLPNPIYDRRQDPYIVRKAKRAISWWTRLVNYGSFQRLNLQKLTRSAASIVFSECMSTRLGGFPHIVYHGAERLHLGAPLNKSQLRKSYSLPEQGRIALALGYATKTKGWDIIEEMDIPDNWTIVINPSKNEYSREEYRIDAHKRNLKNLGLDFLNEEQLCELFSCADAVILPYKVSSASGVLFDGLSYGLPFVASNLEFFDEFASKGLGVTTDRNAAAFSKALLRLDRDYERYADAVGEFSKEITWQQVADEHLALYKQIAKRKEMQLQVEV
jgi:glycosyltransferase involved in cell wall biosynthesis